jgi:tetratricopeptide (TPR) repeat protein
MKLLIILLTLLITSCGSHKLNLASSRSEDTFSNETFMRYGHNRLKNTNTADKLNSALINCYKGKFKKALKSFKYQLNDQRKNNKYWLYIGNCYGLYGNTAKANFYYDYAMSGKNEIKAAVLNNRALMAMKANNFNEASDLLNKAIKLAPSIKVTKYNLAQLYIKFNHTKEARNLLRPYLNSSNDKDLVFSMMNIELIEGNLKQSKHWEEKIAVNDYKREDIALYRALLFFELKEFNKAKEALGLQRPTVIKEINRATNVLKAQIENELNRIQKELNKQDAKRIKGVKSVAFKN